MDECETPAFGELEKLLLANGYKQQRVVIVPDELWYGLRAETHDPFGSVIKSDERVAVWYRNRTMVIPQSRVLDLCNSEVEPDDTIRQ